MNKTRASLLILSLILISIYACKDDDTSTITPTPKTYDAIKAKFGNTIDLANLANYANQEIPSYINKDNTGTNTITDKGATLGRVLFYDKMLSVDNTVACATCHQQDKAFSDSDVASTGVNGTTGRHSMRLINTRFASEKKFFWDERAATLEEQTTQPIQDHAEMGYSGKDGDPSFADLITKLNAEAYYQEFFELVYGDSKITEDRMQKALSQFIRSIQSFDSKYDKGRVDLDNDIDDFSNFSATENLGKTLFLGFPIFDDNGSRTGGGIGCVTCHRSPEFDIDPESKNNGIIGKIGGGTDLTNTRSPTLRDAVNAEGSANGFFMHTAKFGALQGVLSHYNAILNDNDNLDLRLKPNGKLRQLNLTGAERGQVVAFIKTLTGTDVYTNKKWSSPFE